MGIVTDLGKTAKALDFKNHTSIWLAIGQTSPWPDEENPPTEDELASTVSQVVGYKLVGEKWLVKEDTEGTLEVANVYYRKISDSDANTEKPGLVYLKFEIEPTELTIVTYRQIGIFLDLFPTDGNADKSSLLPGEVLTTGRLVYLSNDTPVTRQAETRHVFETVLPM